MKPLSEILSVIKSYETLLAERYGVRITGVFGSYARGTTRSDSDLDLLAEIVRPVSLLELVGAELFLSDALGIQVDLVPERSPREEIRGSITQEAVAL